MSRTRHYPLIPTMLMSRATPLRSLTGLLLLLCAMNFSPSLFGESLELPNSSEISSQLRSHYDELQRARPDYLPRTEHLREDGSPVFVNRLIREDSPYLLQHAHNPVNWYPWGEEAFRAAADSNKPIFLSIGYATCHWCHVMEREVFENFESAEYLNQHFIAIKVDREQNPDVDETFMSAVQMLTGRGGWPLSAWLTPAAQPFYGGTYFPQETFQDLIQRIEDIWQTQPEAIETEAEKIASALKEINQLSQIAEAVGNEHVKLAVDQLLSDHDDLQGGFGGAPKFPRESSLLLLLEQAQATGNTEALEAAHFTLQRIAAGGIHDQVAGGFHRYTVDDDWLIPHFEKMLYNQAYLSRAFLLSYQLTGDWEHGRVAARTLDYILREMRSPNGTFFSATDADSEGEEGRFFVWSVEEIDNTLSAEDAAFAKRIWRMSPEGNFEGHNILRLDDSVVSLLAELQAEGASSGDSANDASLNSKTSMVDLLARIERISKKLLSVRNEREPPLLDDKVITAWNGMAITALVKGSLALQRPEYLQAAIAAATSLLKTQVHEDGLHRINFQGTASVAAGQSDYALLAEALVALYDATGNLLWLQKSEELVSQMNALFLDETGGGYFMGASSVSGAQLPVRPKSLYDNAIPAGTSVALRVLSQLYYRTGNDEYFILAESIVAAMSGSIVRSAPSFSYLLVGLDELYNGENGAHRTVARGKVKLSAKYIDKIDVEKDRIEVAVSIDDGWHINSSNPLQDYLVSTRVSLPDGTQINDITFPQASTKKLGFDRNELSLFEGNILLSWPVSGNFSDTTNTTGNTILRFNVDLQACNDTTCLAPETVSIDLSTASMTPVEDQI